MAASQGSSLELDNLNRYKTTTESHALVAIGGKLPIVFQASTTQLLDIIMTLAPRCQTLSPKQRKKFRQDLNKKLYNKTRPGFYWEAGDSLHIGYAGQPSGANTQHH
jgi:hypothetical protein